jgi:hypothetical protein
MVSQMCEPLIRGTGCTLDLRRDHPLDVHASIVGKHLAAKSRMIGQPPLAAKIDLVRVNIGLDGL